MVSEPSLRVWDSLSLPTDGTELPELRMEHCLDRGYQKGAIILDNK